ncbi:hypothetical protein PEDI_46900 [Persicobacter diffluens]|uniref:Sulfatase N-terminal domain-containing protein n=1 Tax=Persicobacter diffluens TaxID=981 RepID=A0AAN5APS2_9BACT|nr:hypothetical protein PEDI_46900 [Persicobacter diffluens]
MSDDHALKAISAYGKASLIQTPNIDRIANEGALFTKGFVTNSICAPSRAAMLTGKHSFVNGKIDNMQAFDWDQDNFAKSLQANGYETALIGKIHLDGQPQGFDYSDVLHDQGHYYNPDLIHNGDTVRHTGYVTKIITDKALNWLDKTRDKKKPFCMLYHHKAPHRNWHPEPKYHDLYKDTTFMPPASFFNPTQNRGQAAKSAEMMIEKHMDWGHDFKLLHAPNGSPTRFSEELDRFTPEQREEWVAHYGPLNEQFHQDKLSGKELAIWKYNRYIKDYLKVIKSVDDQVGRVLDYLDEQGLADNTIVVYTSDQGFYLGENGWFDKRFMYEESFRTPILMRYPKMIPAKSKVDQLVQNIDFAPTFLEMANVDVPDDIQGKSLVSLFENPKQ